MSAPVVPAAVPGGAVTAPLGGQKTSTNYYDEQGQLHRASKPVPVDQFGRINGAEFRCGRCRIDEWFPSGLKGAPVCGVCDRRMEPVAVRDAPMLPWAELGRAAARPLWPVAALPVAVAAGVGVAGVGVPWLLPLVATPAVGEVARRLAQARIRRRSRKLDRDDPGGQKQLDADIARSARGVAYAAGAAVSWLSAPAVLGVEHPVTWAALLAVWAGPAAVWWRSERDRRNRPEPVVVEEQPPAGPQVNPDEEETLRIWREVVAVRQGQTVTGPDGQPMKATQNGKLPGTTLEAWQPIDGGWSATIAGPVGAYDSDQFAAAPAKIAGAYRMHRSMVTVMPDPEDENRAILMAQRKSPLRDEVRWAGPSSVDVERGVAEVGRYVDGTPLLYELYRPGWGCPHDFMCGTTGAGKSETLSGLLIVDRWASFVDAAGVRRGLVADLLIDPQQGQSYEPFMDDLAAPVATSLDEAMLVVEAFRAEMLRRNAYLSKKGWRDGAGMLHRAEWVDGRGRVRYGRKWWNPLVDGPILTLNIDEAHEYLSHKPFAALITAGARMYRKCGMRIRVATHTPLLTDLGGSMALRDMLTGGFVWVGRTANGLSGPTAFNGRLPVDPRSIPSIPGSGFTLGQLANKPMLSRFMWEPDYYDLVRDAEDRPIGFPAELPAHTLEAFGPEFGSWFAALRAGDEWVPDAAAQERIVVAERTEQTAKSVDAVLDVLAAAVQPLDMDELDAALHNAGTPFSTRTVRDALKKLRDQGLVFTVRGRHELTPQARAEREAGDVSRLELEQLALDEGGW